MNDVLRIRRLLPLSWAVAGMLAFFSPSLAETNAKFFNTAGGVITNVGNYQDWIKKYHTVLPAGLDHQAAFYNRLDQRLRILEFGASGSFQTLATHQGIGKWDIVIRGNFGGSGQFRDLLFYNRSTGNVRVYELDRQGRKVQLFEQNIGGTNAGGSWDVLTGGFLGQVNGRDDLLVYNKTEGLGRFYRVNASGTAFNIKQNYFGWRKNWDQIVPGNIDGDPYVDFLFYNQDGGDSSSASVSNGHAKFISFGATFNLTTISETTTEWPIAENVIVVPGDFGGDSKTDFLVYDQMAGTGRFYRNNGAGNYLISNSYNNWQNRWTHIIPIEASAAETDLLFYTSQRVLNLVFVRTADDFGLNPTSAANVQIWTDFANRVFHKAGIHFRSQVSSRIIKDTDLNIYVCGSGQPIIINPRTGVEVGVFDRYAASVRSSNGGGPNDVVIFVRGGGQSNGCSNPNVDFVIMPQWKATSTTIRMRDGTVSPLQRNPKLLGHELGHYFSLSHTHFDSTAANSLNKASPYDYDADARGGSWAAVLDTPPQVLPSLSVWPSTLTNWCDDSGASTTSSPFGDNDLTITPLSGPPYSLNPERHNVMSSGINCDRLYRLSPGQVRAVRENLWQARSYLLE